MQTHQKTYAHDEFAVRFNKFRANVDFIEEHNAKNVGFTVKMNEFGDMDAKEFGAIYNGFKQVWVFVLFFFAACCSPCAAVLF